MVWPTWPELSQFLLALGFAAGAVGLLVAVWRRPNAALRLRSGERELEIGAQPAEDALSPRVVEASDQLQVAAGTEPEEDRSPTVDAVDPATEWFQHFRRGDLRGGSDHLEAHLATIDNPDRRAAERAFALQVASEAGSGEALTRLIELAETHQAVTQVQFWTGFALHHAGRTDEALNFVWQAFCSAVTDEDRALAASFEATVTSEAQGRDAAAAVLLQRLADVHDHEARTTVISRLARLYAKEAGVEGQLGRSFTEYSLRLDKTNKSRRFDLAHLYSEADQHGLAYRHYSKLVAQDAEHPSALNNLGVAAANLDWDAKAVQLYKRAEALGETLATANLSWKLIHAGFVEEAGERLTAAQEKEDVHRNVLDAVGGIARAQNEEEGKAEHVAERAQTISSWYADLGEALITAPTVSHSFEGRFAGDGVVIECGRPNGGRCQGQLQHGGRTSTVEGHVRGRALFFSWRTVEGAGLLSLLPQTGQGYLLLGVDGSSRGFLHQGTSSVDATTADGWKEFSLERTTDEAS